MGLLDRHTPHPHPPHTARPTRWGSGGWEVANPSPAISQRTAEKPQPGRRGAPRGSRPPRAAGGAGWGKGGEGGAAGDSAARVPRGWGRGCRWSGRAPEGGAQCRRWQSPVLRPRVSGFESHPLPGWSRASLGARGRWWQAPRSNRSSKREGEGAAERTPRGETGSGEAFLKPAPASQARSCGWAGWASPAGKVASKCPFRGSPSAADREALRLSPGLASAATPTCIHFPVSRFWPLGVMPPAE